MTITTVEWVRIYRNCALGRAGEIKQVEVYRRNREWAKPVGSLDPDSWTNCYVNYKTYDRTFSYISPLEALALCAEEEEE